MQSNLPEFVDRKIGLSILGSVEQKFITWAVGKVPASIKSWHLTLASIPISLLIILSGYLAKYEIHWLWFSSALIASQWLTDSLDGAVGRTRKEGLIKWGYYMDHFLDYIFLCAVLIGYMLLLPDHFKYIHFFVLAVFGAFMVNTYLAFATTEKFQIAHMGIGPTEIRLVFILINTLLIFFGKTYLAVALPYVLGASCIGLCVIVYRTQREIWKIDMEKKRQNQKTSL